MDPSKFDLHARMVLFCHA